jgi:hypothetical protein
MTASPPRRQSAKTHRPISKSEYLGCSYDCASCNMETSRAKSQRSGRERVPRLRLNPFKSALGPSFWLHLNARAPPGREPGSVPKADFPNSTGSAASRSAPSFEKVTTLCLRGHKAGGRITDMAFRLNRRFTALATAILFSISVGAHGLAASRASMQAMDVMAASDTQPSTPDSGCGGHDGDGMACFALCAGAVAILPDSATLPVTMAMPQPLLLAERSLPSRDSPPEPAPPRSVILS